MTNRLKRAPLSLLFVILGCAISVGGNTVESETAIYYYPFELETFTPLTPADIEERALCHFVTKGVDVADNIIVKARPSESGTFDERVVRLKAVVGTKNILVDQKGGLLLQEDGSQQDHKINKMHLEELESWVLKLSGQNDC